MHNYIDDNTLTFFMRGHLRGHKIEKDTDEVDIFWSYLKAKWHKLPAKERTADCAHEFIEKELFNHDMRKLLE